MCSSQTARSTQPERDSDSGGALVVLFALHELADSAHGAAEAGRGEVAVGEAVLPLRRRELGPPPRVASAERRVVRNVADVLGEAVPVARKVAGEYYGVAVGDALEDRGAALVNGDGVDEEGVVEPLRIPPRGLLVVLYGEVEAVAREKGQLPLVHVPPPQAQGHAAVAVVLAGAVGVDGEAAPLQLVEEGLAVVLDEGDGARLAWAGGPGEPGRCAPLAHSRVVGDAARGSQQRGVERPRRLGEFVLQDFWFGRRG